MPISRKVITSLVLAASTIAGSSFYAQAHVGADEKDKAPKAKTEQVAKKAAPEATERKRYFMFISDYNSQGWDAIMAAPSDRFADSKAGVEALGGRMLSYYFGLTDNKGYVLMEIPDNPELIKALHLMPLANGNLNSWTSIELMSAADMQGAMEMGNVLRGKPELNKNSKQY
ncbi:GYD domain-containing protein [Vibrio superstes]|uniref:GYD domain-containing protein n=1 Tax=Vibrio superstes NBRC 103154 TaxID=1219062 RepID=A0A511QP06_9VIBR|nr:GYD domain-containing protein [Vibrio superstes]GEM79065.1 hypothetical protein VSU01S_13100 [Vibrio superstes NBRC 103154]